MADENTYIGAVKDRIGDLAHRAYDTASGALSSVSAPLKSAWSSISATSPRSGNADESYEGSGGAARNQQIDQAVKDAGG